MHLPSFLRSFALLLSVIALGASPARAHFVWVDLDTDANEALLFFSEGPQERNYHLPGPIAEAELFGVDAAGNRTPLKTTIKETEDYAGLVAPADTAKLQAIETTCEYGIYAGSLLRYHSQHLGAGEEGHFTVPEKSGLALRIVPERKPGGIAATVRWNGEPVEGAKVTMLDVDGESQEETTDKAGEVFFVAAKPGTVGLMTNHTEKKNGEVDGKKYVGITNYATLTLAYTPSGEAREEMSKEKESEQSQALQLKNTFGPQLPEAVSSFGAAVNDGWLYVYGGHTGRAHQHSRDNLSQHFCRLNLDAPTDWEELPMQTPLQGTALVSSGDLLYRVGGLNARNAREEDADLHSVDEFASFDPKTKTWTSLPPLPAPRSSHDSGALDGKIYLLGGWQLTGDSSGEWQTDALVYDTAAGENGSWEKLPEPPFMRRALAVTAWQNRIWTLGGMDDMGEISRNVFSFDPATGQWAEGPELPGEDMQGFGLSAWGTDSGLYASGTDGVVYQLTDPAGKWEKAAELSFPRFFHRIMPGPHDSLLIVAGASMSEGHVDTIERVDLKPSDTASARKRPQRPSF